MRIGVVSDIHDHLPRLRAALDRLRSVDALVCCGDLCSPFVMKEMAERFRRPVHVVWGNNDGDRWRIGRIASGHGHVTIHGEFAELELGGRRVAVHHFDDVARALVRSGRYDVVCFGHNHRLEINRSGDTLILNPGEVFGELSGASTCAVYDTERHETARIDIEA